MKNRNKKGQFKFIPFKNSHFGALKLMIGMVVLGASLNWLYTPEENKMVSPLVVEKAQAEEPIKFQTNQQVSSPDQKDNPQKLDLIIGEAVDEFFTSRSQRSEVRMIMHCLAHRENGHAANANCGDSGKACGPFQFHEETWSRMRSQMVKQGKAQSMGDRYDIVESTRTTVWAIKNGNGLEWGPILRDSKHSDFATCQVPSWYKEK